jgi:glycosyltransferase involved in cell wall biosynthesis
MTNPIRLSICVSTYKRANFIVETLDSIVSQLPPGVEIVVLDGASPDNTEQVMRAYVDEHPFVSYFREPTNSGADADFDKAVSYARGDYCWLFPDDDLIAPGAILRVLALLEESPDLIVVDAAVRDATLTTTLLPRRMSFSGERRYGPRDGDRLMRDTGEALSFIGAVIIRRAIWLARDRASYYGSLFVHVGVIFQQPPLEKVIAVGEPLIIIRFGNAMWSSYRFEAWAIKWPELIWGFKGYSDEAKSKLGPRHPWRVPKHLLSFRAKGGYSYRDYRRLFANRAIGLGRLPMILVAMVPGKLAHMLGTLYMRLKDKSPLGTYELLHCSPHQNTVSRWLANMGRGGASDPRQADGPSKPE